MKWTSAICSLLNIRAFLRQRHVKENKSRSQSHFFFTADVRNEFETLTPIKVSPPPSVKTYVAYIKSGSINTQLFVFSCCPIRAECLGPAVQSEQVGALTSL